jgi:microcystin-dependent protein
MSIQKIKQESLDFGLTGAVAFFGLNTAPAGWLKANGALVSRTTYASLFAVIGTTYGAGDSSTTFALPDMRGEFPRGWSDGRAVDTGRAFGSAQGQDVQAHSHPITLLQSSNGAFYNFYADARQLGDNPRTFRTTGTDNSSGVETRPRNIALLACIKF